MLAMLIFFVACHSSPADHFAAFADSLSAQGHCVRLYASGPAASKLQNHPLFIPFEEKQPEKIAKLCSESSYVVSDLGHPFSLVFSQALKKEAPHTQHFVYYDNAESFVPGGYSFYVGEALKETEVVLFANAHLACSPLYKEENQEIFIPQEKRIPIGYYPIESAAKLAKIRLQQHKSLKRLFFKKHDQKSQKKLLVYLGGNNSVYYEKAFPAFLDFLNQAHLPDTLVAFQQHPGAKKENRDIAYLKQHPAAEKIVISNWTSENMQIACDGALYYQTSLAPLLALAGIPLMQIGHLPYLDVLTKNGLAPTVNTPQALEQAVSLLSCQTLCPERLKIALGYSEDWKERLEHCFLTPGKKIKER